MATTCLAQASKFASAIMGFFRYARRKTFHHNLSKQLRIEAFAQSANVEWLPNEQLCSVSEEGNGRQGCDEFA